MRTRTFAVFAILPVSCVVAAIIVPPSPFRWFATAMAIFAVSTSFYVVSKRRQFRAGQAPTAPEDGQQLGRFQFSLGMLFGFVTLAACLIAEITWQRQLESQWADAYRLMGISDVVEQAAGTVNVPFSGCAYDSATCDRVSYDNRCWAVQRGVNIPDCFLYTIESSIFGRLRELGAVKIGGGVRHGSSAPADSDPVVSGTDIVYRYGDATGKIVLLLVSRGGKGSGGFLFMYHTQLREPR
jgi:hypothetical protein